jgi:hypothetical protein
MNNETDFKDTAAGQFAITAVEYMKAALVLDQARLKEGKVLFRPTLHLAAHGLELILKACLTLNGHPGTFRGREGHNLWPMWEDDRCSTLRQNVLNNAKTVLVKDQYNDRYGGDVPCPENYQSILDILKVLCALHSEQSETRKSSVDHLRYRMEKKDAPHTPWLVKTLYETSDDFLRQPNHFKLSATS